LSIKTDYKKNITIFDIGIRKMYNT